MESAKFSLSGKTYQELACRFQLSEDVQLRRALDLSREILVTFTMLLFWVRVCLFMLKSKLRRL